MQKDDVSGLKSLGSSTQYKYDEPTVVILETFPNPYPDHTYVVTLIFPEFTSLCPKTGQPDFATITITYDPKERCIESKSLKLYLFAFRNHGSFMENIVNTILRDFLLACQPRWCEVVGEFAARGGVTIKINAVYGK